MDTSGVSEWEDWASARIAELERVISLLQWGSCDDCGHGGYCPLCSGQDETYYDDGGARIEAGEHKLDCPVNIALAEVRS